MSQGTRSTKHPGFRLVTDTGSAIPAPAVAAFLERILPAPIPVRDGKEIELPWDPRLQAPAFVTKVETLTAWILEEHKRVRQEAELKRVPPWELVCVEIPHALCISEEVVNAVVHQLEEQNHEAHGFYDMFPKHNRYWLMMRNSAAEELRYLENSA